MVETDEKAVIPLSVKKSAEAFVRVCRNNNIEVLFLELPSQSSWNYKKHNAVKAYSDKLGVKFIDMNIERDRFGFDWKTDTRDGGNHLNYSGAKKISTWLGNYLGSQYQLEDHRKDSRYQRWQQDSADYNRIVSGADKQPADEN